MSVTNPFRRKALSNGDSNYVYAAVKKDNPKGTAHKPALHSDAPRSQKAKTVRIISPHISTSDHDPTFRQLPDQAVSRYDRSPSPASESERGEQLEDTSLVDPFDIESDPDGETTSEDEENLRRNTKGNTGYIQVTNDIVPPNPFRKTTLSQEPTSAVRRKEAQNSSFAAVPRPLYDVDEFKRLLLTGEKTVSHTNTLSTTAILTPDSSSTDASSISRQPIFEPPRGNQLQDTPRTSQEVSPSSAERTEVEDKLFVGAGKLKPSAPEHRHGKPVVATVQQIASLSKDPKLGIKTNSSFKPEASPVYTSPVSPWTPKDLNKPLPPPPVSPGLPPPAQEATTVDLVTYIQRDSSQPNNPQAPVSRSPSIKSRPAPPPSRRQSLLRPNPLPENPEPRFSISEDICDPSTSKLSTSISKPPPPPPRRHIKARGLSVSSTNSTISATPTTPTDDTPPNSSKSRPPPLPPTRTPSVSSYKRPTRIITNPNSQSMAPPPAPPPRQRGSSQSSLSKPSDILVTKFESEAQTPDVPGVDKLPIPPPAAIASTAAPQFGLGIGGGKDVMADLSALQRDVDELRKKFND
ncbi:hypothetical protein MMC31_000976 [Peltigera leucophlebia]|nr:hypothetical protein [Peltigera leucophlebia]